MSNETTLDDVLALAAKATDARVKARAGRGAFRHDIGVHCVKNPHGHARMDYPIAESVNGDSTPEATRGSPRQNADFIAAAWNYLREHGPALKAALEDARRYRWIAAEAKRYKGDDSPKRLHVSITVPRESDGFLGVRHCPTDLDAAIDAMAAGGES